MLKARSDIALFLPVLPVFNGLIQQPSGQFADSQKLSIKTESRLPQLPSAKQDWQARRAREDKSHPSPWSLLQLLQTSMAGQNGRRQSRLKVLSPERDFF